jgi:rhodanese-related sulfurtransferase
MSKSLPEIGNPEITPPHLAALFNHQGEAAIRLIDCREEDEFAICKIAGAELVPLSRFAAEASQKILQETRPIVVYCHHGMRSLQATHFLRSRGVEQVWSLKGGIDLWSTMIDPLVPRY